jgi:hypothetical protein
MTKATQVTTNIIIPSARRIGHFWEVYTGNRCSAQILKGEVHESHIVGSHQATSERQALLTLELARFVMLHVGRRSQKQLSRGRPHLRVRSRSSGSAIHFPGTFIS